MSISSFRFPTDIRFGENAVALLPEILATSHIKRPLLVTDKALAAQEVCRKVVDLLKDTGIQPIVYAQAQGNPIKSQVMAGVDMYRQEGTDGIVMLGGGCALDVGKAIALMIFHPGDIFDYEDDKPQARPIDQPLPVMVAIPTTAGTGSEVGGSTVISDDHTHRKVIVWSSRLIPKHVLADPELTLSLPPHLTAATGMDALTHAIEAFLAKNYHPICDGIALEGLSLVAQNLEQAVVHPADKSARKAMLMAAIMGAVAFQKGLGVTHSCAHALSTCYGIHHGLANALMIIPAMRFNAEYVPQKFLRLGHAIGITGTDEQVVAGFIHWLVELKQKIGIPLSLQQVNIQPNERLIEVAFNDACHANNPRPCAKDDFRRLFAEAL